MSEAHTDIEFDRHGDISFVGNDISMINSDLDYNYQNVIDRLITNFDDYYLSPNVGANLSSFIGQNINSDLENNIVDNIRIALTSDGFIPVEKLSIATLIDVDSILIKIQVGDNSYLTETIIINSIFNTSSGLFYVTN
ncbi:hypothetical protein N9242_00960 [Vicingaceae bacterium]|nr:hypothetical protein [Vicingaceae bacterium]